MKFVALASFLVCAAPVALAQGTRVNAPVVAGGSVFEYQVSADGSRVFYSADQRTHGKVEIHDAPLDGSQASRVLSAPLPAGRECNTFFALSPDESQLLYLSDAAGVLELYSVPTDGSRVATKLSEPHFQGEPVLMMRWTPDGTRVVYWTPLGAFSERCWSVLADGSQPPAHLATTEMADWGITSDSSYVLILTSTDLLYSVSTDDSAPAQLLSAGSDFVSQFEVAAGKTVVYQDVRSITFEGGPGREDSLFSVPADGSTPPLQILGPFATEATDESEFQLTPDATHALYVAADDALYSARVDGLGAAQLSPSALPNVVVKYRSSPDGSAVAFTCSDAGQVALFLSPTDASIAPSLLFGPTPGSFITPEIGPTHVAFGFRISGDADLYGVPRDGSAPGVELTGPMTVGGNLVGLPLVELSSGFEISPNGRRVVYMADQDTNDVFELYFVPFEAPGSPRKLNGPLVSGGDVKSFVYAPGTDLVLYLADQATNGSDELFMSRYKGFAPVASPAAGPSAQRTVTAD